MTLDEEFAKYQGQSVLVPSEPEDERGQCVQWADFVLHDVFNLPYHYGNAIDWWNNPKELLSENFEKITDGSIKKGDFVVYDARVGSVFGHIDVAAEDGTKLDYLGYDSNWGHNLTVHQVNHNDVYNNYILGSLRLKGNGIVEPADYRANSGDVQNYFKNFLKRDATADDHKIYDNKPHKEIVYAILDSAEYKNLPQSGNFVPVTDQLFKKG